MKNDAEKEAGAVVLRSYANFFKTQYTDYAALSMQLKENKTYMPIQIAMSPNEVILINDLVSSDNTMMTKVLSVLSSLCIEVITLKREANERHFRFLSVYDVYSSDSDISYQMESICLLSTFITRCDETLRNMCSQVFAIFAEEIVNLNGIQLHYIINHIGELFTILVLLETLISRSSLAINWNQFRKNLKGVSIPPEDFTEERLSALNGAIENITTKIMKDDIIQNSLTNVLTLRNKLVDKNCAAVAAEFSNYIKNALITLDKLIQEKPNINNMYRCIKINALFVLYSHLFGCTDKKMFKALVDLDVKVHSVVVVGTTIWFPEQFLQKYASSFCDNHGKLSQTMLKARQSYITNRKLSLSRDIISIQALSTQWILKMEEIFSSNHYKLSASEISLHAKTLLEGLDIASGTYHVVITLMNLHLTLGVPLSKSLLMSIFEIIEMLKSIKDVIVRNGSQITSSINMTLQHLSFQAVSAIQGIKKTLMSDKKYANRLDELTCIVVAERALKGAPTLQRNIAANVALNFVPDSTYIEDTHVKLGMLLEKMHKLSEFTTSLQDLCNCSWILWHQTIISIYFEQNFSTQLYAMKLKYFLLVLEDCVLLLQKTDLLFGANKSKEFIDKAMLLLDENLNNTSQNIETNLRLHIHSHLQLDAVNPFTVDMTKKVILLLDNLRVYRIYISAIPTVEHYLSTMYYNLTTVVLSDWKTYGEMRQMAEFKFNLKTVKDDLPRQTLEQGLDVLEIMRNIHIFVSKYLYNLNNQIFIEKSSNNKHLNSINIQHVANSIRTHGIGIMNTTVNFTYQFLKKKFFTFSQFMYDEHIKSRLIKDLRNFKETADNNENMYQFKNADKFNKGIKTLGTANDGQSYLDLFRDLISQIGNAMGYVRMIRSGGRHCCSDATVFLPSLDITKDFKQITEENKLNNKSIDSAEILDHNINNLVTNFIQGTEYFKLLVDAFAPVFRNPKNVHLKNFFIIIPPLTLNFVEHMILSKDKMSKKNKEGAAFTDDGFAMGIAYILKLLDQDSEFDELHWFESVWKYIKEERQRLEEQKTKGSVQLQQALALTERKIKTLENEFKLLYYSLTSARIFFR